MTTVLVTGGLGFIGRHVARYMRSQGHRVVGVGHGDAAANELDRIGLHRWLSGSVCREAIEVLSEPVDLVVHCAGSSLVGRSFSDPAAEFRNNVGAALDVLEFARRQKKRPRIVMLSSAAVYGIVHRLPIGEDAPLDPISPYGESRREIEVRCRQAGADDGLEISIVRLFSVYGPGLRKQLFWDACRKLTNGDGRFGGTGAEQRDWLHVDDAARLIGVAATQASAQVPIMNGGSGRSFSVSEALSRIRDLLPGSPALTFSGEVRLGDPPGYEADISRANSLDWAPAVDLSAGLADYVLWARDALGK
ncbi:MAG: NAD-dependent epimerase/dehydratase family protein [Afipia sp.]